MSSDTDKMTLFLDVCTAFIDYGSLKNKAMYCVVFLNAVMPDGSKVRGFVFDVTLLKAKPVVNHFGISVEMQKQGRKITPGSW